MKVVFLGATKGMGRALARLMVARDDRLFLLGRDAEDLERSARDLEASADAQSIGTAVCDLMEPAGFAPALDLADRALGNFETVVVTAGAFATQAELEADPGLCRRLLTVDFAHTVLFCEEARKRLLARGGGTLCVLSSVAGERARKPVILYGAAKAGLSHYLEGLDHKFRAAGLKTVCVKPGFVKTGMTAGLEAPPFATDADSAARTILRGLDRGTPVVFAAPVWRWIMLAIRNLPRSAMRRVGF